MPSQVLHRFSVHLNHLEVDVGPLEQILREHAHSGADFEDVTLPLAERVNDRPGYPLVGQEVLPEGFFGSDLRH